MIPWALLDTAAIPGGGVLRLQRRGEEFSIMLAGTELMNSRRGASEEALATQSLARLGERPRSRVLIGGLGMGFTLRAALAELGSGATIEVAELVPAVVAWARGPMAALFGDSLQDPRVAIHEGDVADLIRSGHALYDAILLDVDNGPAGLTRAANDRLYGAMGLAAARAGLRPGGVLGVWSSAADDGFARLLRATGFDVEEVGVRAHGKRGSRHTIWIARSTKRSTA